MIDFIVNETERIFCKAIHTFAKKDMVDVSQISFQMSLREVDGENVVRYDVCHDDVAVRETNIKEVIGVKSFDFKGYTMIVPPKIKEILENFSKALNSKNVDIVVYLSDVDDDKVKYFLYNNNKYVKEFNLIDVLGVENKIT